MAYKRHDVGDFYTSHTVINSTIGRAYSHILEVSSSENIVNMHGERDYIYFKGGI